MDDQPDTPEWAKAIENKTEWVAIESFLEAMKKKDIHLADWKPSYSSGGLSTRDRKLSVMSEDEVTTAIADYFGVDAEKLKREQQAVIDYWAAENLQKDN